MTQQHTTALSRLSWLALLIGLMLTSLATWETPGVTGRASQYFLFDIN